MTQILYFRKSDVFLDPPVYFVSQDMQVDRGVAVDEAIMRVLLPEWDLGILDVERIYSVEIKTLTLWEFRLND